MRPARLAVTCPVVVGRDEVLRLLDDRCGAVADRGLVTLLGGGAGMGKSRLLAEAGQLAAKAGHLVLAGECRQEAAGGYEPFTSALARHERTVSQAEADLLFSGRSRPARVLLPAAFADAHEAAGDASALPVAMVDLLAQLSAYQPVTLLLEDLQWAGRDAIELLLAVAAEVPRLPVWIVGTYRPGEVAAAAAFTRLLTLVDRRTPDDRILLDPLEPTDVDRMLAESFPGQAFDDGFSASLHERSGGNPFVVEELCRTLIDRGELGTAPMRSVGVLDLPETIRTALIGRLDQVGDDGRALLDVAAVAGEELDPSRLMAVLEWDRDRFDRAVAAAIEVGVLAERDDGPVPRDVFTHALIRDAIRATLSAPQRRSLHRRLAYVIAARGGDEIAGEVCDHLVAAGDADQAYDFAVTAARTAATRLRPREAALRFEQAVELAPDETSRAGIAVDAAEFGFYADRPAAVPLADRARRLSQQVGDVDQEIRSLVVLARTRWITGDPDAFAPFERALRLVEGRGDRRELEVTTEAAYHLARTGWLQDAARADALVARATPLAETLDDDPLSARLALVRAARSPDQAGLLAACDDAAVLLSRTGQPWAEASADLLAGHHLVLFHGDLREGSRRLRRHQRVWDDLTLRRPSVPFSGLALASIWMGDGNTAQSLLAQGYWSDSGLSSANWHEGMAELSLARGRTREALTHARDGLALVSPLDEPAATLPLLATLARAQLELEGLATARPTFERALDYAVRSSLTHHWSFSPAYVGALAVAGEIVDAERVVTALADATAVAGNRGQDMAALRYIEGVLATHTGRFEDAVAALEDADRRYAAMPFPARRIRVALAWAEAEQRAGNEVAAVARAKSALVLAQALEGPLLIQRVERLLGRLGRAGRRASAQVVGADALTPREREVVRLTVEGMTAREIGDHLVISHRTVEGHLERARDRLGAATKADLVRIALDLDL